MNILNDIRKGAAPIITGLGAIVAKILDARDIAQLGISWEWWQLVFFALFVFTVIYSLARFRKEPKKIYPEATEDAEKLKTKFYSNRTEMHEDGWGIDAELKKASALWIAMGTGPHFVDMDTANVLRIQRIMFLNPHSTSFEALAKVIDYSEGEIVDRIWKATKKAQQLGLQIRWHDGLPFSAVIGNPNGGNAWARIRTFLPYVQPASRPHYIVHKSNNPELFNEVITAFNGLWNQGVLPPNE